MIVLVIPCPNGLHGLVGALALPLAAAEQLIDLADVIRTKLATPVMAKATNDGTAIDNHV